MRAIDKLRKTIQSEEFDYRRLMQSIHEYRKPRDVVTRLLKAEAIVRMKKGLYVFGDLYRKGPICLESIANLMYGPSYLSLEFALKQYGMIPERVVNITSMTILRSRNFKTPMGTFEYIHLNPEKYSVGVTQAIVDQSHQILIATPEKALADRISTHRNLNNSHDIYVFITQSLRIEEEVLLQLDLSLLQNIAEIYRNPAVTALFELIQEMKC